MSISFAFLALALLQEPSQPRVVEVTPNATGAVTAPGSLPDPVQPGDRLVCRTESVVGSNRRRRVCMTQEQRQAMREQSRDLRERMDGLPAEPRPMGSGG